MTRSHPSPDAPLSRAQILDSTSPHWPGVVECNESVRVKASEIVDWGFTQANTIPPLKAQILKLARSEINELNGVVESNAAEIEGLKEDLAVNIAGYDAEKAEKEERIRERDEANEQLEFLEGELEGVRAEETRLRAEVKSQGEELRDVTKNRDDLDDEVRRLKDLSNAREIEASKLRAQLSDLRQQHAVALSDAQRYMAEADRSRERVGTASAKASAAIEEAAKLRKWQDWAKARGAKGLAYILVGEDGVLGGPVAKNLSESERAGIAEQVGAKNGDAIFFAAGDQRSPTVDIPSGLGQNGWRRIVAARNCYLPCTFRNWQALRSNR